MLPMSSGYNQTKIKSTLLLLTASSQKRKISNIKCNIVTDSCLLTVYRFLFLKPVFLFLKTCIPKYALYLYHQFAQ